MRAVWRLEARCARDVLSCNGVRGFLSCGFLCIDTGVMEMSASGELTD